MSNEERNPFSEPTNIDEGYFSGEVFHPHGRNPPFNEKWGTVRAAMGNAIVYAKKINQPIKASVNGLTVMIEADDTVDSAMAKLQAQNDSPEQKAEYKAQNKETEEKIDADLARVLKDVESLDLNDHKSLIDWVDRYISVLEISGKRDTGAKKIIDVFKKYGLEGDSHVQADRAPFQDPKTIIRFVLSVLKNGQKPSAHLVGSAVTRWRMDQSK